MAYSRGRLVFVICNENRTGSGKFLLVVLPSWAAAASRLRAKVSCVFLKIKRGHVQSAF